MSKATTWDEVFSSVHSTPADKLYCIAFTARSGSTWLGDILCKTGRLGDPREYFNHMAAKYMISHSTAANLREYYEYIKTVSQTDGVFGVEVSYHQMVKYAQEGYPDLLNDIQTWFFLRRKDYVAQAVSLYRATQSGIFHSPGKAAEVPETPYNASEIERFARSALAAEYYFSQFFENKGIKAKELWYEDLLELQTHEIVNLFLEDIGLPRQAAETIESKFTKLSDSCSENLINRFKSENAEFISYWDEWRGKRAVY